MRTNLVRVPALVRYLLIDTLSAMEFYGFNEIFSPIFDKDHKIEIDRSISPFLDDVDDSFRARPFTVLNGCPKDCSFASFGDQLYICGGSTFDSHVMKKICNNAYGYRFETIRKLLNDRTIKYLSQHNNMKSVIQSGSNRVKRFGCQKLVDSLFNNNQKRKIVVGELYEDASNDSPTYWETCPSMSKGRRRAHLLHLGDKLFAIGGNTDGKHTSLIEVFEQGVWTPICTENPPDIDPYFLVSAAIEDANSILIGSKGSFYLLDVMDAGNETVKGRWNKLLGECPSKLLDGCFKQPGIVTKNHYVLWYDDSDLCIYGLNPFSFKCFSFNLVDDIFGPAADSSDIRISKLIDLGEGILCFIYAGWERHRSIDVHGLKHEFCDHHCVTFEINYDSLSQIETNMSFPFPRIELETSVISHYKCYAPARAPDELGPAFALDIHIPHKKVLV